jgi:predicted O-methyltransferase YrrM
MKDLDHFVSYYRTSANARHRMLRKLRNLYDSVWPCNLQDSDLICFLSILYLAVRFFRARVVVQTGTFVGTSTVSIALALQENEYGHLYTIDPEPPWYFGVCNPVNVAREAVVRAGFTKCVHFVKGYSTVPGDARRMRLVSAPTMRLLTVAHQTRFDMIVVDGDHTYQGCYLDLCYGSCGLSAAGPRIIVVHDYLGISDVKRATRIWRREQKALRTKVVPSPCGIALLQLQR